MESILKADIFFFITTACVVLITTLLVMILLHVLRIVRIFRKTVDRVYGEAEGLADDFANFREYMSKNQFGMKPIFDQIKKKTKSYTKKKARAKKKEETPISFS